MRRPGDPHRPKAPPPSTALTAPTAPTALTAPTAPYGPCLPLHWQRLRRDLALQAPDELRARHDLLLLACAACPDGDGAGGGLACADHGHVGDLHGLGVADLVVERLGPLVEVRAQPCIGQLGDE